MEELDADGRRVGNPLVGMLGLDLRGTGPALEAIIVTEPSKGSFSLNGKDGSFDYTPPANFSGQQSFTYAIGPRDSDPQATAIIIVLPVNDAPVVKSITRSISSTSSMALSITVEGTDQETPANDLILNIFTQPALGSVAQTGNLEFSYTPPKGGLATSTDFTFVLRDDGREGLLRRKRLLCMLKRFRPLTLSRLPIQSRVTPPWVTSSTDSAGG